MENEEQKAQPDYKAAMLNKIYMDAFGDTGTWTIEKHVEGLKAVWQDGVISKERREAMLAEEAALASRLEEDAEAKQIVDDILKQMGLENADTRTLTDEQLSELADKVVEAARLKESDEEEILTPDEADAQEYDRAMAEEEASRGTAG